MLYTISSSALAACSTHVPADMNHEPISKFLTQSATTIVIDHADILMRDKDNSDVETLDLVRELIKESENSHKFNMLLVVNSWERAKELVDAGCKLVPGDAPARWTREQLSEALLAIAPNQMKEKKVVKEEQELLRLATLSGTPGYLTFEAYGNSERTCNARHAAMHDLEWRMGTKALYEGSQLALGMKGRFPDKNGIYHHEDLVSLNGNSFNLRLLEL